MNFVRSKPVPIQRQHQKNTVCNKMGSLLVFGCWLRFVSNMFAFFLVGFLFFFVFWHSLYIGIGLDLTKLIKK